jgi:hypothetical protein
MIITRDRYLDDTPQLAMSLVLQTRTAEMHSLLSDASDEIHDEIARILVQALDRLDAALRPEAARRARTQGTASFGCGT